jgi:autotransporter-associated beta strand protein
MVRDAARRLLPHPSIGSAPPGHVTLVNIETVLWVATSPERHLGTVNLLGRSVDIRAHVDRVSWNFGDDSSTTTTGPGKAYTNADPCRTKQCPGYFGHTYTDSGTVTIEADLTWTGQFRVDGGTWQTIPGTVTAEATSTTIDVKEARGVLVPNP